MRIPGLGIHITREEPRHEHIMWHTGWYVRHIRPVIEERGGVLMLVDKTLWEMPEDKREGNILHDTGEIAILSAFFATALANYGAPPANLYLGLDHRAALAEADTLATMAAHELALATSGYERKAVISGGVGTALEDFYINQPAAYYRADSKTVEWTCATNPWAAAVDNLFLCTDTTAVVDAASKHMIASKALSASRTLLVGDKLQASLYVGLSE